MPDPELDRKRRQAGCLPVAEVLVEAGLPADVLERTGLLFPLRQWGKEYGTLSLTVKRWVFGEPWLNSLWVKPGGRAGFLELLHAVLEGRTAVVQVGPWNQQTHDRNLRRAARAVAHEALMERLALLKAAAGSQAGS